MIDKDTNCKRCYDFNEIAVLIHGGQLIYTACPYCKDE
jgi:hypothetical protein